MSRIRLISEETATPEVRELFERERTHVGNLSNFTRGMAYVPAAIKAFGGVTSATRNRNFREKPELVRYQQFAIIRTSAVNRPSGEYCWTHQIQLSEDVGITPEQFAAASGDFEASPLLTETEKIVIRWAEAVTDMSARDDDELFAALKEHFSDSDIVEITLLVCLWNWSNRFTGALHIPVEPPEGRLTLLPNRESSRAVRSDLSSVDDR